MTPQHIYLAGPMRGIPEYNFPAFLLAGDLLRDQGHTVYNPADKDIESGFQWEGTTGNENLAKLEFDIRRAVAQGLKWIAQHANAVVLLDGWQNSSGVRAEVAAAAAVGIPVYVLEHVLRWGFDHAVDLTTTPIPEEPTVDVDGDGFTTDQLRTIALIATARHLRIDEPSWLLWEDWPALTETEFAHITALVASIGERLAALEFGEAKTVVERAQTA